MLDIVSHRARIGQFNSMKHRKCTQTRRPKYQTYFKILIALILAITVASAIVAWAGLIEIPSLGQHIVSLPALGQRASTSILLLCAPPAYRGCKSGPTIVTCLPSLTDSPGKQQFHSQEASRKFSPQNQVQLWQQHNLPARGQLTPHGQRAASRRTGVKSDSGASLLRRLCSGALFTIYTLPLQHNLPARGQLTEYFRQKHCATPAHWGRPAGPIFNECVSPMIQPPRSQVHLEQQ